MSDLFVLFAKLNQKIEASQYQLAKIGIVDSSGNITTKAIGRPDNYIYVRMITGQDTGSVAVVRNRGVAPVYDTTIRIRLDPVNNNEWITYDVDPKFELANPTASPANVPFHRHYIGSGLDDPVELRRFIPCRVWSGGGLTINIDPFPYQWNGVNFFFPGITNLDVSSHVPSSALQRFIVVGVDPITNTVAIIDGPTYSSASIPIYANLLAINTGNIITSGGIALVHTQTIIIEANIYDMRPLLSSVSSSVVTNIDVTYPIVNLGSTTPNIGFGIKYNYTALRDPTSSDDQSQGYSVGSQWINNDTKVFFVCVQSTVGMAIWKDVSTSSSDIASLNVTLSADVAMPSASTYYDSVAIGLTAGTWLITGSVTCSNALPTTFSAKLWDGISDIFDFGASNSIITKIPFSTIVTPRLTTDYKISVSADLINSTILHTNNQTQLSAIRLSIASGSLSGSPIGMLLGITKE